MLLARAWRPRAATSDQTPAMTSDEISDEISGEIETGYAPV
jgi:hypothetical protein